MRYLEEIENYLNNNLSEKDRLSFEKECQTNEALATELAFYLQTQQVFINQKQEAFKQRYKTEQTKKRPTIKRLVWIAASAAAAVVLVWFGLPLFNDYQTNQQLAQIETPVFFLNNQVTRNNDTLTTPQIYWQNAFAAAKNENYKEAIRLTDSLTTTPAIGLKAFCFFELKDYANAAIMYEKYLQKNPPYYERIRSQWNLILTYRFLGENAKEKQLLETIGQEGRKELLEILE